MNTIPPMPAVKPRERVPFLTKPGDTGYLVSFRDYAEDNEEAVEWFLEHSEQIGRAVNSHAELVRALLDAERRFDLLAGWEADSYLVTDYEAMKEVAKDAHREARAALAKVTP